MNTVETYIGQSNIINAGLGLFAKNNIPAGTLVWKFTEFSEIGFSQEEFTKLPEQFRESIKKYLYCYEGEYFLNLDDSRHYNHSDNPNVINKGDDCYSSRDILAGEELLIDYREICDLEWFNTIMGK